MSWSYLMTGLWTVIDDEAVISDETIDELCEALFHANVEQVSKGSYFVGWAPPANAPAPLRNVGNLTTVPPGGGQCPPYSLAPCRLRTAISRPAQPRRQNRIGVVWLAACLLLGGWLGFGGLLTQWSRSAQSGESRPSVSAVAATQAPRTVNIEDIRVGQRVKAGKRDRAGQRDRSNAVRHES